MDDILRTVTTIPVFSNFEYTANHIQLTWFRAYLFTAKHLLHMSTKLIFQHVGFNKDFLFNCSSPPQANSCNDNANIIPPYSNNWDGCNPVKKLTPEELKMAIGALNGTGLL